MRILVTGGAGFIGSNIAERLIENRDNVRVMDNFSTGKRENLRLSGAFPLEVMEGDLCDLNTCRRACENVGFVLHQAAIPSVPKSVADPISSNEANVRGTLNLLVAARDAGVKRLVYASSSSIYGDTPIMPKKEDMTPLPLSPYAISKLTGEYYCRVFYRLYGLETVVLRYFNVFGPRQDPNSQYAAAIPRFITALLNNKPPTVYGDGEQTRDFTYVRSVVEANIQALEAKGAEGEVFNIACGESITINELVKKMAEILNSNIQPIYTDSRPGDIRDSLADISRARRILGYKPPESLETGLAETVNFFRTTV
jgi:nucleoside-diphosphate-sugar epimerase